MVRRGRKENIQVAAKATASVIALVAGGYLMVSGSAAQPAVDESSTEATEIETSESTADDSKSAKKDGNKDDAYETVVSKAKSESDSSKDGETAISKKSSKSSDTESKVVNSAFRSDPEYQTKYDSEEQVEIYGGKYAVEPPRPLLELGREQYTSGMYDQSSTLFGDLNPLLPGLAIYGDWRTAVAYNKNNGKEIAQIATRLNLDIDLKLTGTERIHAFWAPIQNNNVAFTRYEFGGADADDKFNGEFDEEPQTLFFEGDLGSIYSGFYGTEASFDLPFTVGLFPLFLQNGIWANDAILGGAFTLPAKNSPFLNLSNYDITFFAAFDNVDNAGVLKADGKVDNDNTNLFGVTTFIDAFDGYIEAGYGLLQGFDNQDGLLEHYLTASYSRRFGNLLSNTTRVFANFGDNDTSEANGYALISENSIITSMPSTLLPYANFFVGFDNPRPLVDGNGAGILKNVGINFETDALTGYPKLDDTGSNTWGGAIGLQYLFNLDQQFVVEAAMVQPFENDGIGAKDAQYALGARYQVPINRAWLFRADATYQFLESAEDNFGVRSEVRRKF